MHCSLCDQGYTLRDSLVLATAPGDGLRCDQCGVRLCRRPPRKRSKAALLLVACSSAGVLAVCAFGPLPAWAAVLLLLALCAGWLVEARHVELDRARLA